MNKEQTLKFLTDLGIVKERAEKMVKHIPDDAEKSTEEEIEEIYSSIVSKQTELYLNGETYKNEIKQAGNRKLAEALATAEKKIKKIAGLTDEEVKDKKFDDIVELAFSKASKSTDKTVSSVQEELKRVSDELKRVQEEEIPKIKSEVEKEKNEFQIETALNKHANLLKLRQGTDIEDAIILIKNKALKFGYNISVNEKKEIEFKDSEGNKILSQDKKNVLSSTDIINNFLVGQIEKSNADKFDKDGKPITVVVKNKEEIKNPEDTAKVGSTIKDNLDATRKLIEEKRAAINAKK